MAHQNESSTELQKYVAEYKSLNLLIDVTSMKFIYSHQQLKNKSKDFILSFLENNCREHYYQVDKLLNISKDLRAQIWPESLLDYKNEISQKLLDLINGILNTVKLFQSVQKERNIVVNPIPMSSPIFKYNLPKYNGESGSQVHFYTFWRLIEQIQEDGQLTENQLIVLIMRSLEGPALNKFKLIDQDQLSLDMIHSVLKNWFGCKIKLLESLIWDIETVGAIPEGSCDADSEILLKCTSLYSIIRKINALKAEKSMLQNSMLHTALVCILPRSDRRDFSQKLSEENDLLNSFIFILKRIEKRAVESQEYESTKTGLKSSLNQIEDCYYEDDASTKYYREIASDSSSDDEVEEEREDEYEDEPSHANVAVPHNSPHSEQYEDESYKEFETEPDLDGSEEAESSTVEESEEEMETEHAEPQNETDVENRMEEEEIEEDFDDTDEDPDWKADSNSYSDED